MVNSEHLIKRLEKIIHYYGLTAAAFADKIVVQRSSISHLLSGRNKPSLEFVLKIIENFPEVNLYWFLYGQGDFPHKEETETTTTSPLLADKKIKIPKLKTKKVASKVIIFYTDGTFETFNKE